MLEQTERDKKYRRNALNNGFWDRDPEDRARAMERACERNGVSSFWDLPPEERTRAYED